MNEEIDPSENRSGEDRPKRILLRWERSLYKLIWEYFAAYIATYIFISLVYNFMLGDEERRDFESIAAYCARFTSSLPIVLLLGFFTSTSMQRWFSIIGSMPGTAKVITIFILALKDNVQDGLAMIRVYSRWVILSWALLFRRISRPLRKVYPDLTSLQNAGLLLEHERLYLEREQLRNNSDHKLPLVVLEWNIAILKRCTRNGYFNIPVDFNRQVDALMIFKKACSNTLKFALKNISLALIQTVAIAVHSIGVASLMARHLSDKNRANTFITGYLPFLNIIQYFLYYSWLKLGARATNPFGDDDDDVDVNELLQSHIDDAKRLEALYNNGPTDQLVSTSLENTSSCPAYQDVTTDKLGLTLD